MTALSSSFSTDSGTYQEKIMPAGFLAQYSVSNFHVSECSICLNSYNNTDCLPRMLKSCGHTFCEPCLVHLRKSSNNSVVRCPTCRSETRIKPQTEGANGFPKNFALLDCLERARAAEAQLHQLPAVLVSCDRCASSPAEFGCSLC